MPALSAAELTQATPGEPSAAVRERVLAARERQQRRQGKSNALLNVTELDELAAIEPEAKAALSAVLEKLSLSARSYHRILRIARTLADLAGSDTVNQRHVMQAVSFRRTPS